MRNAKLFAVAGLVLLMVLAACGGGDTKSTESTAAQATSGQAASDAEATATKPAAAKKTEAPKAGVTPTEEAAPAETVAPTAASEEDLSLDSITEGLATLKSYKSKYIIRFVGKDAQGQAIDNAWEMAEEFIQEPRAQRILSTSTKKTNDQVTETSLWESITIGQTTYMVGQQADGTRTCVSISSTDATPPEQSLSPDMWGGVSGAKYVNTETVNGIRAKHYAWKEGSFAGFGWLGGKGETWVAVDGGFVVKQYIEGSGKGWLLAGEDQEGTTTVDYEVTEANGSFEILPPEGCEGPSTDIPVMPDALDKMTYGDMVSYRSPTAMAGVKSFYEAEMAANGWTASGTPTEAEGFVQLTFTKDERTASVMLSFDSSTNETTVIVQVTK